jgi:hypothetical protein
MRDAADDRALRDQPIRTDATCGNPRGPQAFLAPGRNIQTDEATTAYVARVSCGGVTRCESHQPQNTEGGFLLTGDLAPLGADAGRRARCGFRLVWLRVGSGRPLRRRRLAWRQCWLLHRGHCGHCGALERIDLRLERRHCVGQRFCCGLFRCQKLKSRLHIACRALLRGLQIFYQPNYLVRVCG